jgi:hypothetical protein
MSSAKTETIAEEASPTEEFKPKLKRRKLAPRRKLCPQCLSDLYLVNSISGWLTPSYYFCSKCGYSGYVALEELPKEDRT